jgi:GT2 family glycosyltransferase
MGTIAAEVATVHEHAERSHGGGGRYHRPVVPPHVSFVIVSWNSRDVLTACLDSIAAHPPSGPWEAIVVDNDSADGSAAAVRDRPHVRVIANDRNRGLAAGNNQGLEAAGADRIIICNPDVEYPPGAIDALLGCLDRHPGAAFVFARLVSPDGTPQTCAGDLPTLRGALLGRQVARRSAGGTTQGFWWDGWAHDEERRIPRGLEACYAVRREAVAEIGPQDEGFPLDWEGIDWCERAAGAGWEVWFCPEAEVRHVGGASIRQAQLRWVMRSHRGMYRYFAKRRPLALRPLLAMAIGARALVKAAAVAAGPARYDRSHPRPS